MNDDALAEIWSRASGGSRVLLSTLLNHHGVRTFPKIPALAGVETEEELEKAISDLEMAAYVSSHQPWTLFFQHRLSGRIHPGLLIRGCE